MGLNNYVKKNQKALSTTAIVGASGTTVALTALSLLAEGVETGTLSANITCTAATASITYTLKWQVSDDNSTWVDCITMNSAANVTLTTGTAAAVSRCVDAPSCVYGKPYARLALVTGAQTAGAGDQYAGSYNYRVSDRY